MQTTAAECQHVYYAEQKQGQLERLLTLSALQLLGGSAITNHH